MHIQHNYYKNRVTIIARTDTTNVLDNLSTADHASILFARVFANIQDINLIIKKNWQRNVIIAPNIQC